MKQNLSGGLVHELPADLASAIRQAERVEDLWESLTPIARNEYLCWIEDAKQEKTRRKRIDRTIDELKDGKRRPCCWPGCVHRTDKKPSQWQQQVLINKNKK